MQNQRCKLKVKIGYFECMDMMTLDQQYPYILGITVPSENVNAPIRYHD